jgi:hypothetical protein
MKEPRMLALGLACALLFADAAHAQSAPPFGLWQGENGSGYLLLQDNGACSASGMINVSGSCNWSATSTGGVLTMTYFWVTDYAHLSWSIRWISRNLILVNEVERFDRRG